MLDSSSCSVTDSASYSTATEEAVIVDRSTLEQYASCPLGARLKEEKCRSTGVIAVSGTVSHDAISETIKHYVESFLHPESGEGSGALPARAIRERLEQHIFSGRPDVQPDVIAAMKYFTWKFSEYIAAISPLDIIAFDGGQDVFTHIPSRDELGEVIRRDDDSIVTEPRCMSGQLDMEFNYGRRIVRVTCEVDLLHETRTKGLVKLVDWKTGFSEYTESVIENDFQLGCVYPLLVLDSCPDAAAVDVVVANTRSSQWTMPVRFYRSDMPSMMARVSSAVNLFMQNRKLPIESVAAHPSREACRLCSAAAFCRVCDEDIKSIKADPVKACDRLYALHRAIEEIEDTLKTCCKGGDIITPGGNCYGFNKPKRKTKPKAALYQTKATSDSEEEE